MLTGKEISIKFGETGMSIVSKKKKEKKSFHHCNFEGFYGFCYYKRLGHVQKERNILPMFR